MMLKVTKAIYTIMNKHFTDMLKAGAFPAVHYEYGGVFTSFHMFEYSNTWATYSKLVDKRMKEKLNDPLGIFTRKHSAPLLEEVQKIVDEVAEADVLLQGKDRFHSFADDVMAEAMK
jgi:hypothetical protein